MATSLTHITLSPADYDVVALADYASKEVEYTPGVSRDEMPQKLDKTTGLPVWAVDARIRHDGETIHSGKVKILSQSEPRVADLERIPASSVRVTPWADDRGKRARVEFSWAVIPATAPAGPVTKGDAK